LFRRVSISFAEIFLFPLDQLAEQLAQESESFNLLCGDFFISTTQHFCSWIHHLMVSISFAEIFLFPLLNYLLFHLCFFCLVSISFAEIFLFPPVPSRRESPAGDGDFNLLCGDFFISTGQHGLHRIKSIGRISISFAEIFLFPQTNVNGLGINDIKISISFAEIFLFPHVTKSWLSYQRLG